MGFSLISMLDMNANLKLFQFYSDFNRFVELGNPLIYKNNAVPSITPNF